MCSCSRRKVLVKSVEDEETEPISFILSRIQADDVSCCYVSLCKKEKKEEEEEYTSKEIIALISSQ